MKPIRLTIREWKGDDEHDDHRFEITINEHGEPEIHHVYQGLAQRDNSVGLVVGCVPMTVDLEIKVEASP